MYLSSSSGDTMSRSFLSSCLVYSCHSLHLSCLHWFLSLHQVLLQSPTLFLTCSTI